MCKLVPYVHASRILVEHLHVKSDCFRDLGELLVGQHFTQRNLLRAAVTIWLGDDSPESGEQITESIGISKSSAQSAVKWLARRKLLAVHKETATAVPDYRVLSPWRERQPGTRHRS